MADVFALFGVYERLDIRNIQQNGKIRGKRAMGTRPLHQIGINKYN